MKNPIQSLFFSATSTLTKYFPRLGARLLDFPIRLLIGNRWLAALLSRLNRNKLRRVARYRRFLVNPDIHIGDAIMAQSVVTALRDFFPNAEVDFVTNRSVLPLVEGNPEVTRFHPIYSGGAFPPDSELETVANLLRQGNYDLCINSNPFLAGAKISTRSHPVFDVTTHAPTLVRNEATTEEINHFSFQYQRFVHQLLERVAARQRELPFPGVTVKLSEAAIEKAHQFLESCGPGERPVVLLNTDTASPYTRVPFSYQVDLAVRLLGNGVCLLVGAGHNEPGIGRRIIDAIPSSLQSKAHLIPAEMSLETYSALGDLSDLFITGDTGPMHIAAARKFTRTVKYSVRNRTAVLCLFGATTARMSGYASAQPGYLPANQDAPSWTIVAKSPCRNITCLNKMFKTCETVRCFEEMDLDSLVTLVTPHLTQVKPQRASESVGKPADTLSPL